MHLFLLPTAIVAALLATSVSANCNCVNFTVPVEVQDVTAAILSVNLSDGFAATSFANSLTRRGAPTPKIQTTNLTKIFNISAEYCSPENANSSTLQILTHGIGFDRSYWDYRPPNDPMSTEYSYVYAATTAGYSTLAWNRLGIAPSTIANPVTEIQSLVELAVLAKLTEMAKTGGIPQVPQPSKVLHVGHSFGSQMTLGLAGSTPELSDGVILTGFSNLYDWQADFVASSSFHVINTNQPQRFPPSIYSNEFLTWGDVYAYQYSFLEYPYFDSLVAEDNEAHKYPFTAGEFLTSGLFPRTAPDFTGPAMYLAASNDLIFCGGNCTGLFNASSPAVTAFNTSSDVTVYIQPNSGHALNVHYNATGGYAVILDWAKSHGF